MSGRYRVDPEPYAIRRYETASSRPGTLSIASGGMPYTRCRLPRRAPSVSSIARIPNLQPKRHKTVRHARRLSTVEAPFFPSYLFTVLDLTRHQWRSVSGTFGVSRLVCG